MDGTEVEIFAITIDKTAQHHARQARLLTVCDGVFRVSIPEQLIEALPHLQQHSLSNSINC
jgi:hypothetical protein